MAPILPVRCGYAALRLLCPAPLPVFLSRRYSIIPCVYFSRCTHDAALDITRQVDHMVHSVGLRSKRHAFARTLSGGQKRKLSVAIAFVGGSKVGVLLYSS